MATTAMYRIASNLIVVAVLSAPQLAVGARPNKDLAINLRSGLEDMQGPQINDHDKQNAWEVSQRLNQAKLLHVMDKKGNRDFDAKMRDFDAKLRDFQAWIKQFEKDFSAATEMRWNQDELYSEPKAAASVTKEEDWDCNDMFDSNFKVNSVVAERCLEASTKPVHIKIPTGEYELGSTLRLKSGATMILQGGSDEADVVLKCSKAFPAFVFDDGATLILDHVVVKQCGAEKSGGAISIGKENVTLVLQHGAGIRDAAGNGVFLSARAKNSQVLLKDHSTISDSGRVGLYVNGGENHAFLLANSSINDSRHDGIHTNAGKNHRFILASSTISGSHRHGLIVDDGTSHSFSLGYSTISSQENAIGLLDGTSHSFSLGYSTIRGSEENAIGLSEGTSHSFSLGYSMIDGTKWDGISVKGGKSHSFSLGYSTIARCEENGIWFKGESHSFSLSHCKIMDNEYAGIRMQNGNNHRFSLGYSTISGNKMHGIQVTLDEGENLSFSLGYSTITGSGSNGIVIGGGKNHSFNVGHSLINGSDVNGIRVNGGERLSFSLGYSTINGSTKSGIEITGGKSHSFGLRYSTIGSSGEHGVYLEGGKYQSLSLGYSTIDASREQGIFAYGGQSHSVSLGHSTINGSGEDGIRVYRGTGHTFNLGYAMVTRSAHTGVKSYGGQNHTFSLSNSTISNSGYAGLHAFGATKGVFNLGYSTIKDCMEDCISTRGGSESSMFIGGCIFEACAVSAVGTGSSDAANMTVMNTSFKDCDYGLKLDSDSTVNIRNSSFSRLSSAAISLFSGLLYSENIQVYTSGTAFDVKNVSWLGSNVTAIGNGMGITCSSASRGAINASFVYLNGLWDTHKCGRLALEQPLPLLVHEENLQTYLFISLFTVMALTVILPIIQDPPRGVRDISFLLMILGVAVAALWLGTITVVLWTVRELFQRDEQDEDKYGANAGAVGRRFLLILAVGIATTILATIAAILGRKKYTFLRSTVQSLLDSEERNRYQQDLIEQRGEYSKKLHEYHESMVKYVLRATQCKTVAEGKSFLKEATEQFDQVQSLAKNVGKKLDMKLHHDAQQAYQNDPPRWQTLLDVENVTLSSGRCQGEHVIPFCKIIAGDVELITEEHLNDEVTRHLILAARWGRCMFQEALEKIATRLNESEHVDDIIHKLSDEFPSVARQLETIQPEVRNLNDRRYKLLGDVTATLTGQHCNVKMGPNKTYPSASRKAASLQDEHDSKAPKDGSEWQKPAARYLLDLLRATVVFADPVSLVVYFHMLATEFTIISTKNKYKDPLEKVGSPSILVNIEIDTLFGKLTSEVQLYLDKFIDLKFLSHVTYEIERVQDLVDILPPFHD